ncbi:hypothetical protein FEI15_10065 [Lacticaseibacillus zeae]|uniref:Uncharacterized protein n=1 Tax=Lacticaseibacillus zeae TaxID=57037 RepID=A0A5R8LN25_LACZE|nr:hypothetical protein FEI15_10065 [Lacticaseibacillus zeae]
MIWKRLRVRLTEGECLEIEALVALGVMADFAIAPKVVTRSFLKLRTSCRTVTIKVSLPPIE